MSDNMFLRKTVLGAGLFSAVAKHRSIQVADMWWFWAAITFPLTGAIILLWGVFCWRQEITVRLEDIMAGRRLKKSNDIEAKA